MKTIALVLAACMLAATTAFASGQMTDDDWVLSPGEVHSLAFTLATPTTLSVEMVPIKNADKGVMLRVVPADDLTACSGQGQGQCRSRGEFDGFQVRSFSHTGIVPAGRWVFFVKNDQNILHRAIVHVRVSAQ